MGRNLPFRLQHTRPRSPAVSSLEATELMMAPSLAPPREGKWKGMKAYPTPTGVRLYVFTSGLP